MSISDKINKFIEENGGNERDALNVALARLENVQNQYTIIANDLKKERENVEFWKEQAKSQ